MAGGEGAVLRPTKPPKWGWGERLHTRDEKKLLMEVRPMHIENTRACTHSTNSHTNAHKTRTENPHITIL
jgi:hypothetical protein